MLHHLTQQHGTNFRMTICCGLTIGTLGSNGAGAVRRSGSWFPERGCILEYQIFRFAEMILSWQAQHFVWPGITFSWQAQYFRDMGWKNCKLHWYEAVSSASFHYWRKSRRIASALMLPTSKLRTSHRIASFLMLPPSKVEDVSQNCFFFDVIKSKSWGSLAELLRFQACRLQIDR